MLAGGRQGRAALGGGVGAATAAVLASILPSGWLIKQDKKEDMHMQEFVALHVASLPAAAFCNKLGECQQQKSCV